MNLLMQAGPLVWLVLVLGVVALVAAIRYAKERNERDSSMAISATIASALVAILATVTGFQKSVGGLRDVAADDRWIYLWGLKESLNNIVVAGIFAFLVTLLLMVGSYRRAAA